MKYEHEIDPGNRVFVNRTLNLNNIKLVGFDMDYTLVTYNVPAFEEATYKIVLQKLVHDLGYPKEILKLEFNPKFIIRGLVIDIEQGNFIKVNRYGYVKKVSHGTRFISFDEQKKAYSSSSIDWADPRYYIIHTLFSLAEGCLFAQLVDFYDDQKKPGNLKQVFKDIRTSVDDAHQEGSLKGQVTQEPDKFLIRKPALVEALKKFKMFGKKLALITNSDYDYSQKVMDYCFTPFFEGPWQDLFDIIIVSSNKPTFFSQKQKFLKVDRKTGQLSNFHETIKWGQIYQGGNARIFEKDMGLSASEILYIGDHIYGDVVSLKEAIGWRTGLVVQELESEVPILERNVTTHQHVLHHMREKEKIETELYALKEQSWNLPHEKRDPLIEKKKDDYRHRMTKLDELLSQLISEEQKDFNPYWGEVMRAGNEESRFATLVERYACIYMSCVSSLNNYSPFKYFRSKRRFLAHDPMPFDALPPEAQK